MMAKTLSGVEGNPYRDAGGRFASASSADPSITAKIQNLLAGISGNDVDIDADTQARLNTLNARIAGLGSLEADLDRVNNAVERAEGGVSTAKRKIDQYGRSDRFGRSYHSKDSFQDRLDNLDRATARLEKARERQHKALSSSIKDVVDIKAEKAAYIAERTKILRNVKKAKNAAQLGRIIGRGAGGVAGIVAGEVAWQSGEYVARTHGEEIIKSIMGDRSRVKRKQLQTLKDLSTHQKVSRKLIETAVSASHNINTQISLTTDRAERKRLVEKWRRMNSIAHGGLKDFKLITKQFQQAYDVIQDDIRGD